MKLSLLVLTPALNDAKRSAIRDWRMTERSAPAAKPDPDAGRRGPARPHDIETAVVVDIRRPRDLGGRISRLDAIRTAGPARERSLIRDERVAEGAGAVAGPEPRARRRRRGAAVVDPQDVDPSVAVEVAGVRRFVRGISGLDAIGDAEWRRPRERTGVDDRRVLERTVAVAKPRPRTGVRRHAAAIVHPEDVGAAVAVDVDEERDLGRRVAGLDDIRSAWKRADEAAEIDDRRRIERAIAVAEPHPGARIGRHSGRRRSPRSRRAQYRH